MTACTALCWRQQQQPSSSAHVEDRKSALHVGRRYALHLASCHIQRIFRKFGQQRVHSHLGGVERGVVDLKDEVTGGGPEKKNPLKKSRLAFRETARTRKRKAAAGTLPDRASAPCHPHSKRAAAAAAAATDLSRRHHQRPDTCCCAAQRASPLPPTSLITDGGWTQPVQTTAGVCAQHTKRTCTTTRCSRVAATVRASAHRLRLSGGRVPSGRRTGAGPALRSAARLSPAVAAGQYSPVATSYPAAYRRQRVVLTLPASITPPELAFTATAGPPGATFSSTGRSESGGAPAVCCCCAVRRREPAAALVSKLCRCAGRGRPPAVPAGRSRRAGAGRASATCAWGIACKTSICGH